MTRLTFPESAPDLLARSHEMLDRHVTPHTPGESGWAIGGGSALAARLAAPLEQGPRHHRRERDGVRPTHGSRVW